MTKLVYKVLKNRKMIMLPYIQLTIQLYSIRSGRAVTGAKKRIRETMARSRTLATRGDTEALCQCEMLQHDDCERVFALTVYKLRAQHSLTRKPLLEVAPTTITATFLTNRDNGSVYLIDSAGCYLFTVYSSDLLLATISHPSCCFPPVM